MPPTERSVAGRRESGAHVLGVAERCRAAGAIGLQARVVCQACNQLHPGLLILLQVIVQPNFALLH